MPSVILRIAALALLLPFTAGAAPLRILTSMAPSLTDPFVEAFHAQHPGAEVLVLNKNTNSALDEVTRGNQRGFDIFWASSPEAFALIARHDGFDAADCAALPPEGHDVFALSSIGWAERAGAALAMPEDWGDLLQPGYRGQIGMALPSRSGTAHMMVERFLQVRGWRGGWDYFLRLSENLSTLTSRSFGVIDGVKSDRFALGLTIDFLAGTEPGLDFRYGQPVLIFPAQIGRLAGGTAPDLACEFARFVLSDDGHRLLLEPSVGRVPASAAIRDRAGAAVPDLMRHAIRLKWQTYDAGLAEQRYWAVNGLFDIFISDLLPQRRELWGRLRALEGRASPADLARIEKLLTALPVPEAEAAAPTLNSRPGRITDLSAMTPEQKAAHDRWLGIAARLLDQADAALTALERRTDGAVR